MFSVIGTGREHQENQQPMKIPEPLTELLKEQFLKLNLNIVLF